VSNKDGDYMKRLDGKVAVITGSGTGIGKSIALRFAQEGADIVLNGRRTEPIDTAADEIKKIGRKVVAVAADISTKEGAERLINTALKTFGKVDILVNNAGIPCVTSLLDISEDEWDRTHNVDLKGVFLCTQAVARHMIERKYGKIINITSAHGLGNAVGPLVYAAAKAGAIQVTKTCARELGPYGINVNAIAPGSVITEMTHMGRTPEEVEKIIENRKKAAALKRSGTVEDIANLALFLASDESSFITAQTIACDGGRMDRM
jgi:NAD(P)-dependent dehydrogenase (short-subunit alcohol dehydrogenase family)